MAATEIKAFVFTDVVGSTRLKKLMPGRDSAERNLLFTEKILQPHRALIDDVLQRFDGRLISTQGDGHFLEFQSPAQAVLWAVEVQQRHADTPIVTPAGDALGVKIGIHMGPASADPSQEGNYVGTSVDYAARLVKLATQGKIIVSEVVATFVRDEEIAGVAFYEHGFYELAGIGDKRVFEVIYGEQTPGPLNGDARALDSPPPTAVGGGSGINLAGVATVHEPRSGLRIKDYELLEEIGEGGMGKVFKARHIGMGRICVLKLIKDSLLRPGNEEILDRFYQEIQIVAKLKHPNIVQAYHSSSRDDEHHFLVMEYIEGETLDTAIADRGSLPLGEACEIVRQAACGLQYIHEHGLVHRDIKPSNLMIATGATTMGNDNVKILDLGLALLVKGDDGRITRHRDRAIGTAYYMAPEQWTSTTVDIRADIYSLGCSFYHMVCGKPPFEDSGVSQEQAHRFVEIPPPKGMEPVPAPIEEIFLKMLAKKPEERFAQPIEVAQALDHFSDASTLGAGRPRRREALPPRPGQSPKTPAGGHDDTMISGDTSGDQKTGRPTLRHAGSIAGLVALLFVGLLLVPQFFVTGPKRVINSSQNEAAEHFVLTMPGMNGGWWFEEIPWFFPEMRQHLLGQLTVEQYNELAKLARQPDVDQFYRVLHARCVESLQAEKDGRPLVSDRFQQLFEELEDARPFDEFDPESSNSSVWTRAAALLPGGGEDPAGEDADANNVDASDLHLLALLKWKMRSPDEATGLFEQARDAYHTGNKYLKALAIADSARVNHMLREYREAGREYTSARRTVPDIDLSPALAIFCYGMEAEANLYDPSKPSGSIPGLFEEAREQFGDQFAANHPMWALLLSREALYYLETWQFQQAVEKSEEAYRMFAPLSRRQQAATLYFRSRQFAAMAHHFLGDMDKAESEFKALLQFIDDLLASSEFAEQEKPQWSSLKPNLLGRLADVQLFGKGQAAVAAGTWDKATDEARSFAGGPKAPYLARLQFKRSIAYSLAGKTEDAQSARAQAVAVAAEVREEDVEVFRVFDDISAAFLLPADEQIPALMKVVDDSAETARTTSTPGRTNRDDRQVLLFVCDYILAKSVAGESAIDAARLLLVREQRAQLGSVLGENYLKQLESSAAKLVGQSA